jgi:replicative DNA helicase
MTSVSHDSSSTPDTASIRGAPWSNEAEQAVLGAMLLDNDAALRGLELLDDPHFYRESHRRVFRAMRRLVERRVNIDHVTRAMSWSAAASSSASAARYTSPS